MFRTRVIATLVVSSPLAFAGCGTSAGGHQPSPSRCDTAVLKLQFMGTSAATGSVGGQFQLLNPPAAQTCWAEGYPRLSALDHSGIPQPLSVQNGQDPLGTTNQPVSRVILGPDGTAHFIAVWSEIPLGTEPCPTPATLVVALPESPGQMSTPATLSNGASFSPCGLPPNVFVSPLLPGPARVGR